MLLQDGLEDIVGIRIVRWMGSLQSDICGYLILILATLLRQLTNVLARINVQEIALMLVEQTLSDSVVVGELLEDLADVDLLADFTDGIVVRAEYSTSRFNCSHDSQRLVRQIAEEDDEVEPID